MRHLIDIADLTRDEILEILTLAEDIIDNRSKYSDACQGRKLATLFYEPSTRTRLSFEAAMLELGGSVLGFSDAQSSSASKGETVADTARVISSFADIVAMRHPREGAPKVASQYASVPIINAGDGSHSHPTQTLTDLLTIKRELGRLDNLTIGVCGDLKYGRTVHSLLKAMMRFQNIEVALISPRELALPSYTLTEIEKSNYGWIYNPPKIEDIIEKLDVLYMTRVQRERFADLESYERVKDSFVLDAEKMQRAKEKMIVMHPLPRVNEIVTEVDSDPRAAYFRQVEYGKIVRMALILTLLRWRDEGATKINSAEYCVAKCSNKNCISAVEQVAQLTVLDGASTRRCAYCEAEIVWNE